MWGEGEREGPSTDGEVKKTRSSDEVRITTTSLLNVSQVTESIKQVSRGTGDCYRDRPKGITFRGLVMMLVAARRQAIGRSKKLKGRTAPYSLRQVTSRQHITAFTRL